MGLYPGLEDTTVHRRVDDEGSGEAMAPQSGDECLRLPFAEGGIGDKPLTLPRPSGALGQARVRRCLIDEDEPRQCLVEEPGSMIDPKLTRLGDLRPALLACPEAFFYC